MAKYESKYLRKQINLKVIEARKAVRFNPAKLWDVLTKKQRNELILIIWDEGLYHTPEYRMPLLEVYNKAGKELSPEFRKILSRLT